ncbi:MAG: hypothetical protein U1F10_13580 [Burkholderiales bacterium]
MKKTSSYLKGLAERRARLAAEILRLERLQVDIDGSLQAARKKLESCDLLIRDFDDRLDPKVIQPIRATAGRYGPRGALRNAAMAAARAASPQPISAIEIAHYVRAVLNLEFPTPAERTRWFKNSLRPALQKLGEDGVLVRLPDGDDQYDRSGIWQWPKADDGEKPAQLETQRHE